MAVVASAQDAMWVFDPEAQGAHTASRQEPNDGVSLVKQSA